MIGILVAAALEMQAQGIRPDGWGFADWGASQAEVIEASGGRAAPGNTNYQRCPIQVLDVSPIAGSAVQRVAFCFTDDDRLDRVVVVLEDHAAALEERLAALYGEPVYRDPRTPMVVYRDPVNRVSIRVIGREVDDAVLQVSPFVAGL